MKAIVAVYGLEGLIERFDAGERPTEFNAVIPITYGYDPVAEEDYAFIPARFSDDTRVYPEVEGDTYAELVGVRVYLNTTNLKETA